MPKIQINNLSDDEIQLNNAANKKYYLDLIKANIISSLKCNALNYCENNDTEQKSDVIINLNTISNNTEDFGIIISYENGNANSKRLANIIFENIKRIYFEPEKVKLSSENKHNTSSDELKVIITFENLENKENINFIRENIENISVQILMSLTEFFGIPFVFCEENMYGMATQDESIRKRPNLNSETISSTQENKKIKILGRWENWYIVSNNDDIGYIETKYIET